MQSRKIRLNSNYLILFRNIHDQKQISTFAQQMYPEFWREFMDIYADATSIPYGYLFLDNQPPTHPLLLICAKLTRYYQLVHTLPTNKMLWKNHSFIEHKATSWVSELAHIIFNIFKISTNQSWAFRLSELSFFCFVTTIGFFLFCTISRNGSW